MPNRGIIDIVCNVHTPETIKANQFGADEYFMKKVRMSEQVRAGVPMEQYVEKMDRAGIERSLLIAMRGGDMRVKHSHMIPYEDVAAICKRWPDRFHGLAGIDPSRIMRGLAEFEYAITELGFVGAHLYPHWFEQAPDSPMYYPFYAKCCELNVPIMMQVGHCLDYFRDRILPSVGRPITLDRVAIDFPELKLIGIHMGWPWVEEMIAVSFKHDNVYIAGDAYAPKHWPPNFVHYLNSWGSHKVLFGTDWAAIDPERAVREVDELGLRPEAWQAVMRDNAMRLFGLPETANAADTEGTPESVGA